MNPERAQQILVQVEAAAQEVLLSKRELVAMDSARQKTREGFRALKNTNSPNGKAWMSFGGGLFVKTASSTAINILQKDLKEIDEEIADLRGRMKQQVNKLRDLEGKPELKGFDLTPITKDVEVLLGSTSG